MIIPVQFDWQNVRAFAYNSSTLVYIASKLNYIHLN